MHICTKYEASMFKPVARRGAQMPPPMPMMTPTMHDGQSMIAQVSSAGKPNEPKSVTFVNIQMGGGFYNGKLSKREKQKGRKLRPYLLGEK